MGGAKRFFLSNFAAIAGRGALTPFETFEQALKWIVQEA
jgi:hypothetical protein